MRQQRREESPICQKHTDFSEKQRIGKLPALIVGAGKVPAAAGYEIVRMRGKKALVYLASAYTLRTRTLSQV